MDPISSISSSILASTSPILASLSLISNFADDDSSDHYLYTVSSKYFSAKYNVLNPYDANKVTLSYVDLNS